MAFFACPERSKTFRVASNSYNGPKRIGTFFQSLTNGWVLAKWKADEVARNGVLQRITSARGFL